MKERDRERQAEGKAGSMQGAGHGTRSWVSRTTPWAEGGAKPLSHQGCPRYFILKTDQTAKFLAHSANVQATNASSATERQSLVE